MKCISFFVCFFIALNQIQLLDYEMIISRYEQEIISIEEDDVVHFSYSLSKLRKQLNRLNISVQQKEKSYQKQYEAYDVSRLNNRLLLQKDIGASFLKTCQMGSFDYFHYSSIFEEYNILLSKKKQSEKILHKLQKCRNERSRYEDWIFRIDELQAYLLSKYHSFSGLSLEGESSKENTLQGDEALPGYGGIEDLDTSGFSCLVDGNYMIDTFSDSWQFPIDGGTISAGTWQYPDGGLHLGLDVASSMYSPVLAMANGLILYAHAPNESDDGYLGNWQGWPSGGGNTICMIVAVCDQLYGVSLCHLSNELMVTAGQQVHQGDVLAFSGNSGNSTGPHTHIEIIQLTVSLEEAVAYFKEGADFSFGNGYDAPGTCSAYGCRVRPEEVLGV